MKMIYKFPLEITDDQIVRIPGLYRLISVYMQREQLVLYAMVDDALPGKRINIRIIGTGHPIKDDILDYTFIGTAGQVNDRLMWHVFAKDTE